MDHENDDHKEEIQYIEMNLNIHFFQKEKTDNKENKIYHVIINQEKIYFKINLLVVID